MTIPPDASVLVLLVATDGARWLPDVIAGLRAQRYRKLDVIGIDNASGDASGSLLIDALGENRVVTMERRVGYGRALAAGLKVAADRNLDADAFLLLHDDCALTPGALERMLEQMERTGAGIVGPKLLEWDDASVLQEVGQTTDRYGRIVPRVERGELDQGQHDGVHDVLFVSSAAMLVAREAIEKVGLFDLRYVAMRDDLDLCWRARIAGFGTIVVADAAARHAAAAARDLRTSPVRRRTRYFGERNTIATVIKNYSLPRLLFALPFTVVASLVNALLFLVSGRRRTALQVLEAVQWNVVHLPSTVRARLRAQRTRSVGDRAVTALMHHGASRMRSQLERAVEKVVGEVEEGTDEDLDRPPPTLVDRARAHPTGALLLLALVVGLVGARTAFFSGPMAAADMPPFPDSARDLFDSYASGWRGGGSGGAAPATPALLVFGLFSVLSFGSTWLAQRLFVLALPLIGAIAMYRLARALGLGPAGRRIATVLYVVSPLMLGSFGDGRMQELALLAAAPALLMPLLRAAGVVDEDKWRSVAAGVLGLAVVTSISPWTLLFVLAAGVVLLGLARLRGKPQLMPIVRRTAVLVGGALLLLVPWSLELFGRGTPLWSGLREQGARAFELAALVPGGGNPVPLALGLSLSAAAVAGVVLSPEGKRRATVALAMLGGAGLLLAWLAARGVPVAPRPGLPLVMLAVASAPLAAAGAELALPLLRTRTFGALHVAVAVLGIGLAALASWGSLWIASGSRPGWGAGDELLPSFFVDEARRIGTFRVAWIGGDVRAPAVSLTGPEGATMTTYLARPAGAASRTFEQAVAALAGGRTTEAARTLATLGVRYVIVRPDAGERLRDAVDEQLDLSFYQRFHTALVYRNEISLPVAAAVSSPGWARAAARRSDQPTLAEPVAGVRPFRSARPTSYSGRAEAGEVVLLAQDFSPSWTATIGDRVLTPERSFGWATRFEVPRGADGVVQVRWLGQRWHRAALLVQILIVGAFAVAWSQRAARERGER